jgi:ATP-binding protein involved in chromosome partitioning
MKIAMPVADGKLCAHFGHCQVFALFEVDTENKKIIRREDHTPPMHEPGVLPRWLSEKGVNLILSGGMGSRAQRFFWHYGVDVLVGVAHSGVPEDVVHDYLSNNLEAGENICDH